MLLLTTKTFFSTIVISLFMSEKRKVPNVENETLCSFGGLGAFSFSPHYSAGRRRRVEVSALPLFSIFIFGVEICFIFIFGVEVVSACVIMQDHV